MPKRKQRRWDVPPDPTPQRPNFFEWIFTPQTKEAGSDDETSDDEEDEEVDEDFDQQQPISFKQMAEQLEANSKNLVKTRCEKFDKKCSEMDPIAKRIDELEHRMFKIEEGIDAKADNAVLESISRAGVELDKMETRTKVLDRGGHEVQSDSEPTPGTHPAVVNCTGAHLQRTPQAAEPRATEERRDRCIRQSEHVVQREDREQRCSVR